MAENNKDQKYIVNHMKLQSSLLMDSNKILEDIYKHFTDEKKDDTNKTDANKLAKQLLDNAKIDGKNIKSISEGLKDFDGKTYQNSENYVKFIENYCKTILTLSNSVSEKDLQKNVKVLSSVANISGSLIKNIAYSAKHIPLAYVTVGGFTSVINKLLSNINPKDKLNYDEVKGNIKMLTAVGTSSQAIIEILANTKGLKLAEKNIPILTSVIQSILNIQNKITENSRSKQNSRNSPLGELGAMGASIRGFAISLASSVPFLIIGAVALPLLALSAVTLGYMLSKMPDAKDTNDKSKSLMFIGLSVLAFAGSLALASVVLTATSLVGVGSLFLAVVTTVGLFHLLGTYGKESKKGAADLLWMSGSILAFSLSMLVASKVIDGTNVIGTILTIAGVGGLLYLFGKGFDEIGIGALAMGIAGLALFVLSFPLQKISEVITKNPSVLWQLPTALIEIGGAFALAGTGPMPVFIGLGALAMGGVGLALMAISKGVSMFPILDKKSADAIGYTLKSVITGIGQSFSDLSLKDSLTLPLKLPIIGLMGLSLMGLGKGLSTYKAVSGSWSKDDSKNLSTTIISVSSAFATAGSTEGMNTFLGFSVGDNAIERGIESTRNIGVTLESLARGVIAWKGLIDPKDLAIVSKNIQDTLAVIPGAFASSGSTSGMREFAGIQFGQNDVSRGIESTKSIGNTLISLQKGVSAWRPGGKSAINPADIPLISKNITDLLDVIPSAFAKIGSKDRKTEGWFPWSDGDVTNGIELVNKLSPSLDTIAKLVMSSKNVNIGSFGTDLQTGMGKIFGAVTDTKNVTQKDMVRFATVTKLYSNLTKLATPFDNMAKAIEKSNVALAKQFSIINSGKTSNLELLARYGDGLTKLGTADYSMERNVEAINYGKNVNMTPTKAPIQQQIEEEYDTYEIAKKTNSKQQKTSNTKEKPQGDTEMLKEIIMQLSQNIQMLVEVQIAQSKELSAMKNHLMTGTISTKESNKY